MQFDIKKIKDIFFKKSQQEKQELELDRKRVLKETESIIKNYFVDVDKKVEIYLIGSILKPYQFNKHSDINIVIKGSDKSKLDIWLDLEERFSRKIDVVSYEKCHFKDFIDKYGIRII